MKPFLAIDTETENIVEENVPRMVVLSICEDDLEPRVYGRKDAVHILRKYHDYNWVFHNTPFDFEVIKKYLLEVTGKDVHDFLCKKVDDGQIWGTDIAYRLLSLATTGDVPYRWALDYVAKQELGIEVYKGEEVRMGWNADIPFEEIEPARLHYAAEDAKITMMLWQGFWKRLQKYDKYLSHKQQIAKQIALNGISHTGIGFDLNQKQRFLDAIGEEISEHVAVLAEHGWRKGTGSSVPLQAALVEFEKASGVHLPRTTKGISASAKEITDALESAGLSTEPFPFVHSYMQYQQLTKQASFVQKLEKNRIHPRFDWLKRTGRTSCTKPNLQNLPRREGVRECFVPKPGHIFVAVDYSALELCTLAQSCYSRFGFSKMREVINQGIDLHKWYASHAANVSVSEVTDEQRQGGKACNFGYPGGLGVATYIKWAKQTYSVVRTEEEAKADKAFWMKSFPEMELHLKQTDRFDWSKGSFDEVGINRGVALRIIGGATCSATSGKPYSQKTIDWVRNEVMPALGIECTGYKSLEAATSETIKLSTGLIRANARYCAARNIEFQGLAAAGAGIACWEAYKARLPIVNFVHDELIGEFPIEQAAEKAKQLSQLMIDAMKQVVPDVEITTEITLMTHWSKGAKSPTENGVMLIYDGAHEDACTQCGKKRVKFLNHKGQLALIRCSNKKCKNQLKFL